MNAQIWKNPNREMETKVSNLMGILKFKSTIYDMTSSLHGYEYILETEERVGKLKERSIEIV